MKPHIFCLFLFLMCMHVGYAQLLHIKGRVVNETKTPVVGAIIKTKSGKSTVTTNEKGNFYLSIEKVPTEIAIAAIGYKSLEIKVRSADTSKGLEIVLKSVKESLDEVVVVGYGTRDFESVAPAISYDKTLSGKVSGVSIRGVSSSMSRKSEASITYKSGITSTKGSLIADSISSGVKPGMLTAGELSDFKKWKLWSNYSKDEFQQWKHHWAANFQNRYCVQVQNKAFKAVVNEKVYLINKTLGDTLWQAVTDNTGKAELWDDLDSGKSNSNDYFIYCDNQKLSKPVLFENGINRILLNKSCDVFTAADIAFVVDATGSMGDEIRYLQTELNDIVNEISVRHKDIALRTGAVFYRDHGDEYLTRFSALSNKTEKLTGFIANQSAGGGGDGPEAVEEALSVAIEQLDWNAAARSRIIFLVLDAPPHDRDKGRMKELMWDAAAKGIRIVPVVCSGIDKSAEYLMRCIALATNGSYVFLTDDSGIGNPHIKPTTDEFKVEFLNGLIVRLVNEMLYVLPCTNVATDPFVKIAAPVGTSTQVQIYPNPSSGRFMVQSVEKIKEYYVADFAGKMLFQISKDEKAQKVELDLSNYPSGSYLLKYFVEGKGWGSEKLVLIH